MPKPKRGAAHSGKTLTLEHLSAHFHRPINDVARTLGVCVTVLKQVCREHGIVRWPYRKVRKLDSIIQALQGEAGAQQAAQQVADTPEGAEAPAADGAAKPADCSGGSTDTALSGAPAAAAAEADEAAPAPVPAAVLPELQAKLDAVKETRSKLLMDPNSKVHLSVGKLKRAKAGVAGAGEAKGKAGRGRGGGRERKASVGDGVSPTIAPAQASPMPAHMAAYYNPAQMFMLPAPHPMAFGAPPQYSQYSQYSNATAGFMPHNHSSGSLVSYGCTSPGSGPDAGRQAMMAAEMADHMAGSSNSLVSLESGGGASRAVATAQQQWTHATQYAQAAQAAHAAHAAQFIQLPPNAMLPPMPAQPAQMMQRWYMQQMTDGPGGSSAAAALAPPDLPVSKR